MNRFTAMMIACLTMSPGAAGAGELSDIVGDWRTVKHGADVKITDCGDGSPCGFLQSVSSDVSRGHTRDINNPDPDLRDRPLDGLPLLWGYEPGDKGWRKGQLYNPETGQTFRSFLVLLSRDRLRVQGCIGPLCRQQIWTRIIEPETVEMSGVRND